MKEKVIRLPFKSLNKKPWHEHYKMTEKSNDMGIINEIKSNDRNIKT